MIEIPILFSAPMVLANLREEYPKVVTRRIMNPQPPAWCTEFGFTAFTPERHISGRGMYEGELAEKFFKCPYGQAGDRLWMRESFWHYGRWEPTGKRTITGRPEMRFIPAGDHIIHSADHPRKPTSIIPLPPFIDDWHLRPSIFMPRKACRLLLDVVYVRAEPLQEITEADARNEGIEYEGEGVFFAGVDGTAWDSAAGSYRKLWEIINGTASWGKNPLVWVVRYKRVETL